MSELRCLPDVNREGAIFCGFATLSFCFPRAFLATLSTKSGVFVDRRQKLMLLSMKRAVFVDRRDSRSSRD